MSEPHRTATDIRDQLPSCILCVSRIKHPREHHDLTLERAKLYASIRAYRRILADAEWHGWVKVASAAATITGNRERRLRKVEATLAPYRIPDYYGPEYHA